MTKSTSRAAGVSTQEEPSAEVKKEERELLSQYAKVLALSVHDDVKLQVHAVYAVQVFCHNHNFPKGWSPIKETLILLFRNILYISFATCTEPRNQENIFTLIF